jgi:hypothetical protein
MKTKFIYIFLISVAFFLYFLSNGKHSSPELKLHTISNFSNLKTKAIAASCAFSGGVPVPGSGSGHTEEFTSCNTEINCSGVMVPKIGTSQCGGVCQPNSTICPYYVPVITYQNPAQIINNVYIYNNDTAPTPSYVVVNSTPTTVCEIRRTSNDGSVNENRIELYSNRTIWSNQQSKQYPYQETIRVRCASDSTKLVNVSFIERQAKIAHPNWGGICTGLPNACGQTNTAVYDENGICTATIPANPSACSIVNNCGQVYNGYNCPAGCTATIGISDLNSSCINYFRVDPNVTVPNGYVDLAWDFGSMNNVNANCSIYNINNPASPVPIIGLQNLSLSQVNGRINNVQQEMNVELQCAFTNASTGQSFGQVLKKQFIKLFRVIEN